MKIGRAFRKKIINIVICLGIVLCAAILVISPPELIHHIIKRLDHLIYDMQLRTTLVKNENISSVISIIDIDERTLKEQGRWPWSREKLAQLVVQLRSAGAVVITFDMVFSEPQLNIMNQAVKAMEAQRVSNPQVVSYLQSIAPQFDEDLNFSKVLNQNDVVLGFILYRNANVNVGLLPPTSIKPVKVDLEKLEVVSLDAFTSNLPILQRNANLGGFLTTLGDEDGVIRRSPLVLRYKDTLYPSLALEAARVYLLEDDITLNVVNVGGSEVPVSVSLGKQVIPTDSIGQMVIPYRGFKGTFPYFSATDVLNGKLKPEELKDKLVFVGTSALGMADLQNTPLQNVFPGVEIQATMAQAIIDGKYVYQPYWKHAAELIEIIIIGLILTLLFPFLGMLWITALSFCAIAALFLFDCWLYKEHGIIISSTVAMFMVLALYLTTVAYGFLFENKRGRVLSKAFSQYVPPEHAKRIAENPDSYGLEGETRELTVLFADIRGFTTLSETLDANQLKLLLNRYFTPMTEIIFNQGGTIDKYVGDMIMAFWGAPVTDLQHREHALETALDMIAMTDKLKIDFAELGLPEINIGIGLNTGNMNVGDMGSEFRRSYTVLGDAVNLGSRIEGTTKYYGVKIALGENTRDDSGRYVLRKLDRVKVKGKKQGVELYELVCRRTEATPAVLQEIEQHETAINYYFKQKFDVAEQIFTILHQQYPERVLYSLFIERINYFKTHPPGPEWDGSYERTEK